MVIVITTGGALGGGMAFKWSQDGGATYTTAVSGASTVDLGSSGLTANFATGVYPTGNIYRAGFYSAADGYSITTAFYPSTHLHCLRNHIVAAWDDFGIALYNTDYSEIVGNTIDMGGPSNRRNPDVRLHRAQIGDDREDSGYGAIVYTETPRSGNRIQGNTISNSAGTGIYFQNNIDFQCSGNVLIDTCQNQGDASLTVGAIAADAGEGTITGNTIKCSGKSGIAIKGGYYTIVGNRIDDCANKYGIFFDGNVNQTTVSGNQISNCAMGIYSANQSRCDKCTIVGNAICKATGSSAIELHAATNCSVVGNQIDTASLDGILLYNFDDDAVSNNDAGSNNIVQGNGVTGAADGGWAYEILSSHTLVLNNIATSGQKGILVTGDYCFVSGNDMSAMSGTPYSLSGTGLVALANRTTGGGVV